jgi:ABC-type dipeptide/oligopeptide/nickel transport system permease component
MKAAVTTMVIALVFAIIVYIIPNTPGAMDILNSNDKSQVEFGNQTYSFSSEDEFLISETTAVEFKITNGLQVNSSIYLKNEWEKGDNPQVVNGSMSQEFYPGGTDKFKFKGDLEYGKYVLVVENDNSETVNVEYTVHRKVKDSLFYTLLIFCICFAVLEGIWTGVTAAIKHKYKADSIYR